jgi:hypothetical protein
MAQPGSSSDAPAAAGSSQASASLSSVLPWLRSVGIWWDETLVDIRAGCSGTSGPDLGVFAVTDIKENQARGNSPSSQLVTAAASAPAAAPASKQTVPSTLPASNSLFLPPPCVLCPAAAAAAVRHPALSDTIPPHDQPGISVGAGAPGRRAGPCDSSHV